MMKITRQTHNRLMARRRIRFLILSMLVVLLGGLLTLFWQEQQRQISHAAGDIIVGPPSLSAAAVDAIFTRAGSPMAGTGQTVVAESRRTHIDDAFALGVWWAETNDGMAGVGINNRNPGGVQGANGYASYANYADAEIDWFNIVQSRYISRGLTSVYTICYPYVGTSGALNWANKVMNYMSSYRASSPPPPAAVIHKPIPTAAVMVKPQINTNTHKTIAPAQKAQSQKVAQPVTSPKGSVNATSTQSISQSTQLLLIGLGLMVALLLAVPGLLIRRKQLAIGQIKQQPEGISMPGLSFEEQATHNLPITTALGMDMGAISMPQPKPLYTNQYSPVLASANVNTNQLAFDLNVSPLPAIPTAPSFAEHILQAEPIAVGNGVVPVPPTPLQRIPATPFFQHVPATPLLPHSSQGGLLTRYNTQSKPRRIALTRSSGNTNPHKLIPRPNANTEEAEPQPHPHTESLH